ncbi:MAG TPA: glycosyltransferase [Stellaceae bacterium]|nr:glycosyltransferase [Stellaceae bacterium]
MASICAGVLTYNRKELLASCLASLLAQTRLPDQIIVIDNGSSDGTEDLLRARGYLDDPRITLIRLEQNIGAAGGFAALFRAAFDGGFDWGWFMDDDVITEPDALAELIAAFTANFSHPAEIGFLTSAAVGPDGRSNDVPQLDDRPGVNGFPEWEHLLASGLVKIRSCMLNAVLIPRTTLERFGAPSTDFVIWGEDTDYSLRVTEERPGYLVGRSRITHLRPVNGHLSIHTETEPSRIGRFFYLYRNTVYLRRRFWKRRELFFFLVRAVTDAAACLGHGPYRFWRFGLVVSGTVSGLFFHPRTVRLAAGEAKAPRKLADHARAARSASVALR